MPLPDVERLAMFKLLIIMLLAPVVAFATTYSLMYFSPGNEMEQRLFINAGMDIVHVYEDGSIDFVANDWDREILIEMGLFCTTRIADLERFYAAQMGSRTMGGFMTWDEVQAWLTQLHNLYPDITSAPTSIGNTYQGRPQLVMKISTNNTFTADDPSMANAWYDGLIHAREGAAMLNVQSFMEWLCENYDRDGFCGFQATWLLENREIWCLPCNNVDGWVYNESTSPGGGGMQRKNMNWSAGGDGIDLNRNWAVAWGGAGSSGSPSSSTYRGTAPLSEPETSNIDDFWQGHIPTQMHSTHTYGNILIYPWGWTDDPTTHAAQYATQGEIMVQWATGETHGPSAQILYYSSGNTRDHSYGLYGAMSWNHETGADFEGFWPTATQVVKLTRRNLRSYLVTAFMAGCPYNPHVPGTPTVSPIGTVNPPFTVDWTDVSGATLYGLQRLAGYSVPLDNPGSSGPFNLINWSMTTSQSHSPPQCYVSNGTGTMTWTETVSIPSNGGGRLSFWSEYSISGSYLGALEVSTDGGANWYYLQTFGRSDMTWRYNIHELDEWQGETLSFRWESFGSSTDLYIDDIKVEVWDENDFISTTIPTSSWTFSTHPMGEYWFRAFAIDPDFGPGWPSDAEYALVQTVGIEEGETGPDLLTTLLGTISPNPVTVSAAISVNLAASDAGNAGLYVFDLTGRMVKDLSGMLQQPGSSVVHWNCTAEDGTPVPDGIYFCRLQTDDLQEVRRLIVIR